MAKYVCEKDCTFQAPGSGYARVYVRGETLIIPGEWKGRNTTDKAGKEILVGIPRHFRKLKAKETPEELEEAELSDDPMDRALSGEPTSLSEFSKQSVTLDGTKPPKK